MKYIFAFIILGLLIILWIIWACIRVGDLAEENRQKTKEDKK